ncbi:MAG: sugar transferase, partial [Planctomycetes bacterium]|nr:sugar transferase [Planctomycetota bacterium]
MPTCSPEQTVKERPADRVADRPALTKLQGAFNRRFREIHATVVAVADALMIFLGFLLGYWLRFHSGAFPGGVLLSVHECFTLILWLVVIWVFACPAFEIYPFRTGFTWTHLFIKVMEAVALATGVSLVLNQLSGVRHSRLLIVFGWAFSLVLIGLARYAINVVVSVLRSWRIGIVRAAIIGTHEPVRDIVELMQSHPSLGYEVAGIIGADDGETFGRGTMRVPLLGSIEGLRGIVRNNAIDELIIALPHSERERILDILAEFETDAVSVRIVSSVIDRLTRPVEVGEIGNIRLLALREHPLTGWAGVVKRMMDFTISLVALTLTAPLLGAIAMAIKVTSPGPVLYKQIRVGRDDRPFTMYKFRSMRVGAEEHTGPVWAKAEDDRRTRLGTFLRRTSLDELPQLYNILLGQMSLVGPRPE